MEIRHFLCFCPKLFIFFKIPKLGGVKCWDVCLSGCTRPTDDSSFAFFFHQLETKIFCNSWYHCTTTLSLITCTDFQLRYMLRWRESDDLENQLIIIITVTTNEWWVRRGWIYFFFFKSWHLSEIPNLEIGQCFIQKAWYVLK